MDFSEVMAQVRTWLASAAKTLGFMWQTKKMLVIGIFLLLSLGVIVWARFGFTVEIGQFFAQEPTECVPVTEPTWKDGDDACEPKPSPAITAPPPPENWWPHRTLQNRQGLPGLATSAPYGGDETGYTCFGFTIPEGNAWSKIDALKGGVVPATKGKHVLTGKFYNNCPWEVEMTGGAAGHPKAGNGHIFKTDGTIDEPVVGLDEAITRGTMKVIPSCWNFSHLPGAPIPPGCTGNYSITLDLGRFNAGRVEASLGWVHHDKIGTAPGNKTIQDGYGIVANSGRDCTGASGEYCAGLGADGIGIGSGGRCDTEEHKETLSEPEYGYWDQLHHSCGSPWLERKVTRVLQCNSNFSYNGWSAAQWEKAMQIKIDWQNNECEQWASCEMSTADAYQTWWDTFHHHTGWKGDEGITCVCEDPECYEFMYFYCITMPHKSDRLNQACGKEACTNAGYIDRDGDGICEPPGAPSVCGDDVCDASESFETCPDDCPSTAICGDGTCDADESCDSCASDCSCEGLTCGDDVCDASETNETCSDDCPLTGPICGDGVCNGNETNGTCPDDCPPVTTGPFCGDGICTSPETSQSCPQDCGALEPSIVSPSPGVVLQTSPSPGVVLQNGQTRAAGQTSTGPAAATFLAFMLASVTVLLYVSYTHTALFRRREIRKVQGDQGPLDFRQ